jgi:hypothetical protein
MISRTISRGSRPSSNSPAGTSQVMKPRPRLNCIPILEGSAKRLLKELSVSLSKPVAFFESGTSLSAISTAALISLEPRYSLAESALPTRDYLPTSRTSSSAGSDGSPT